jgi:hypothetical protein
MLLKVNKHNEQLNQNAHILKGVLFLLVLFTLLLTIISLK